MVKINYDTSYLIKIIKIQEKGIKQEFVKNWLFYHNKDNILKNCKEALKEYYANKEYNRTHCHYCGQELKGDL
jgi:hypothetical protein